MNLENINCVCVCVCTCETHNKIIYVERDYNISSAYRSRFTVKNVMRAHDNKYLIVLLSNQSGAGSMCSLQQGRIF